jgi:basic amino acid/polyamine antiporter, APA family
MKNSLFRKLDVDKLLSKNKKVQLPQTLTAFDLIILGVGAIIGTGIFILPGTVAALHAGPGIIFSFVIAAIVCCFAAMCYSEFSAALPVTGSAYTYSYIVFGEFIAWLVGWTLLLEYGLATSAVSTGWSAYFVSLLEGLNIHFPTALSAAYNPDAGTYINLPAILMVLAIAALLSIGMKESARLNKIMVFIKVAVILLFIVVGVFYVEPTNWTPMLPFGFSGVLTGAALVFFAYLGFDAVSGAAEEVKNPQRNMPIGIIGSLLVCTILYVIVSLVLTGVAPYTSLNVSDPVSFALQLVNQDWAAGIISVGAIIGMTTVVLVMMYGGTRLIYAFSRDGLLPKSMSDIHPKYKTPVKNTWALAIVTAVVAGVVPLDKITSLVNMGTLIAFTVVSIGVIFLRRNEKVQSTGFKVPFYPVVPIISFILCIFLITQLEVETFVYCGIWFIVGIIFYFAYGRKHSKLNQK